MQQLKTSKLQPIIEKLTLFLSIILEAGCIIVCYQKICIGQAAAAAALFVAATLTVALFLLLVFHLLNIILLPKRNPQISRISNRTISYIKNRKREFLKSVLPVFLSLGK